MKKALSIFTVFFISHLNAEESVPEIIEVLAPKQTLSQSSASHTKTSINDSTTASVERTIADRISTISGVSLNGQGGQIQSYAIRGFSRARIRTELDGIPIITDRRAGNSLSFISPDLINGGYVVKGPSSTLYGSQALGGVVSLSTEQAQSTVVNVTGKTDNSALNFSFLHNTEQLTSAFAYQSADNSETPNGSSLNTQFSRVSGLLRYKTNFDELSATFSWLPSYGRDIGKSNVKYPDSEVSDYPEESHSLAQIQITSANDWTAKIYHHYQNWDSATTRIDQYHSLTKYQSHSLGGQWLQEYQVANLDNYWGIDWLSRKGVNIVSDYVIFAPQNSDILLANELDGNEDNLALYNKSQWFWAGNNFDLSLRYDWLKQTSPNGQSLSDGKMNSSIAVSRLVNESLSISLDLGTGFRFPSLSERYFSGITPRGFISGNKELKPETSIGGQLGLTWHLTNNVSVHSAVYHYELDNYIERYRINDEQLSYRNLNNATITGVETELQWHISEQVEHHFSYQQQTGEDEASNTLADLFPRKFGWLMRLNYESWSVNNSVVYYLETKDIADSESPREQVMVWNSSINYQLYDNQDITLAINNLSNAEYYASLDEDATLQPQRNFSISSRWIF